MKMLKSILSLLLVIIIAVAMIPVCFAEETENPYVSIDLSEEVLAAKPTTLNGTNINDLPTARLSIATTEIFMQNIENTTDKNALYSQCNTLNSNNSFSEFGWELISTSLTLSDYAEKIYEQLKNGVPVLVHRAAYGTYVPSIPSTAQYYRSAEWAIIVGYSGSDTKLDTSSFMVVDVAPAAVAYNHCTLSYWLGLSTVSAIAFRKDGLDYTSVWENDFSVKSATYTTTDNEIVFKVTTAPNFNRVKVTYANALGSYISYSSDYSIKPSGEYVFTLKVPFVAGATQYAFDGRRSDTNRYAKNYFYKTTEVDEVEIDPLIIDVSHEVNGDNVIFTIVTQPGNFDRIKLTTPDALTGSLGVDTTYETNADGNYVWTIKEPMPTEATTFAFDLRSTDTGKYTKRYAYYEFKPAAPSIIGVTHTISDGKLVLTVETTAGDFSRIKVTTADNLNGSLAITSKYTINDNGNYVWTIKTNISSESISYAFDLRSSVSGKYLKDYFHYDVEAKTPSIISTSHEIVNEKIIFTVVTKAGNYDRIKVTLANNLGGSIAISTTPTGNENGNYVWTIKAPAPAETANYAFDLRATGGRYLKDYYLYTA